ncbi:toll-interacting protein isoform X2 [Hyalella azteca]|uniref:Toll-interacting protein isoform X2 n=1 Tax=Hyalella azteca TaxID=294128 RepID=A0A8B7PF88_HYAAZ|nr:toll-interacting protein isoform X2 [Hyalella azteca]
MASSVNGVSAHRNDYRKRVVLGPLPEDFLRVNNGCTERQQQEQTDHAMAAQLQMMNRTQPVVGRLQVTVVRATLHKNYGISRMDPFARLHFGQQVFETHTDPNGAKNPVWNKTFYIYQLPRSFNSFLVEIYDERTLSDDERIAWVTVPLPQSITQGEICDKWYKLSGRLGEEMEGSIHVIMSYQTGVAPPAAPMVMYGGVGYPTMTPYASSVPVYQMPQPAPRPAPPPITDDDVRPLLAMFPKVEADVVRSVLEASYGNKEAAVEALLAMQHTES